MLAITLLANESEREKVARSCFAVNAIGAVDFLLALGENDPSWVLIDFEHPEVDPWQILEICRSQAPGARIYATGLPHDFGVWAKLIRNGVHDFLSKPLNPEDLMAASAA